MNITTEYLSLHAQYKKQYGERAVILYLVGSFFECYNAGEGPDLHALSKVSNLQISRKDKSKPESINNPAFVGFQQNSLEKYIEMFISSDYTVIVYDQKVTLNPDAKRVADQKVITRVLNGIYTRSTFIANTKQNDTNYLMCVYIVNDPQRDSHPLKSVGLSCVELSTGEIYVHSGYSDKFDEFLALDEATRFIQNINPSEILIYYDNQNQKKNDTAKSEDLKDYYCAYFGVDSIKCRYYNSIDIKYKKNSFQNEIFRKVYPDAESLLSPIEQLNLEKEQNMTISLCLLFDFVYDKISILLKSVKKPNFYCDNEHLILGNNCLAQLDIFQSQESMACKSRYKSIFDVCDNTRTIMGKRYLKQLLSSPLTSKSKLTKLYDITQKFIDLKIPTLINDNLDSISDIERLSRRMGLRMIKPHELPSFVSSYEQIAIIINALIQTKDFETIVKGKTILKDIGNFLKCINDTFDTEKLSMCDTTFDKKIEIFKKDVHKDIDELNDNISSGTQTIEVLCQALTKLFPKTGSRFGNTNKITIKHNDKDSYYLKLSEKNGKQLQALLKHVTTLDIGSKKLQSGDLEFSYNKDTAKITIPVLTEHSASLDEYGEKLAQLYKSHYLDDIEAIHNKFAKLFKECTEIVTKTDYHASCATLATNFGYCRPIIDEKPYGFINAKSLRHPLVERLIDYEYTPHDICIGNDDLKGMLLFGINSSGKSVLMKTCGVALLLVQAGIFVPADSFTFSPYKSLFTRISGSDNIYKGQSSYTVELVEINSILKRSNEYSLVIGDEIARGTEHVSGTALVGSTIIELSKKKPTFVFTTHLHDLMKIKSVTDITNVKPFHLKVTYDDKSKALVYDRKIECGSGPTEYGLIVARYVIQDHQFNDQCIKIRNELLEQYDSLVSSKLSRYAAEVYMTACCLCGKKNSTAHPIIESHHINPQSQGDEFGNVKGKPFMKMHSAQNILQICTQCHDEIHANKRVVTGYTATTRGRKLVAEKKE